MTISEICDTKVIQTNPDEIQMGTVENPVLNLQIPIVNLDNPFVVLENPTVNLENPMGNLLDVSNA